MVMQQSTVEPTGTSTSILTTGDGYKWKYMYSLSASQQVNFLSTDFMAVGAIQLYHQRR